MPIEREPCLAHAVLARFVHAGNERHALRSAPAAIKRGTSVSAGSSSARQHDHVGRFATLLRAWPRLAGRHSSRDVGGEHRLAQSRVATEQRGLTRPNTPGQTGSRGTGAMLAALTTMAPGIVLTAAASYRHELVVVRSSLVPSWRPTIELSRASSTTRTSAWCLMRLTTPRSRWQRVEFVAHGRIEGAQQRQLDGDAFHDRAVEVARGAVLHSLSRIRPANLRGALGSCARPRVALQRHSLRHRLKQRHCVCDVLRGFAEPSAVDAVAVRCVPRTKEF